MIVIAPDYFNIVSAEQYNRFCDAFIPFALSCPCPYCSAFGFLILWGYYHKSFIILDEHNPSHLITIDIQRIRCKNCRKTFSLLPDSVIPRCRLSVMELYKILRDYFSGRHIPEHLSDLISGTDISRYTKRYLEWKQRFNGPDILSVTLHELRKSFKEESLPFLFAT